MQIISKREQIECVRYSRSFSWVDDPGAGFGFDCDEHGNVLTEQFSPEALDNLAKCLSGEFNVTDDGIEKYEWSYTQPAIGRCSCGSEVELYGFTNSCSCGRDYNSSGQLLAPRSQWGEETGESLADILRIS